MEASEFRDLIARLPDPQVTLDQFATKAEADDYLAWWDSHRQGLLNWLAEYDTPGYYNRQKPGQDARFCYNHLQAPQSMLWLADALGESPEVLAQAQQAVIDAGGNLSAQSGALRRVIPWTRIEELIGRLPA